MMVRMMMRILNSLGLGSKPKAAARFWNFVKNEEENTAELLLYGPIAETSWWGDEVTPKQFAEDLAGLGQVSNITVRINSGGGDLFAGQTIYNLLKSHAASVTARIDGLAASAASVIAMAGDEIVMPGNAMMMIHNPASIAWGDSRDMRKMADVLDQARETILAAYQAKTGLDREQLISMLDSETWMTAEEAQDLGFVDTVTEPVRVAASLKPGVYVVNGHEIDLSDMRTWPGRLLATAEAPGEEEGADAADGDEEAGAGDVEDSGDVAAESAPSEDPQEGGNDGAAAEDDAGDPIEAAVKAERERLLAIDELAAGIAGIDDLVFRAKSSDTSAADFAVEVLRSGKAANSALLEARRKASNAAQIPASGADMTTTEAERETRAAAIAEQIKARRGRS